MIKGFGFCIVFRFIFAKDAFKVLACDLFPIAFVF